MSATADVASIEWKPIEGVDKVRRNCLIKTTFAKKRADHRNAILKDIASRMESSISPRVPDDYKNPFDPKKCAYCGIDKIGKAGDEFRPISQRGRMNRVNCVPCCGACNSSKCDKTGVNLIAWLKITCEEKQFEKIMKWYETNEKYMIIPLEAVDKNSGKCYSEIGDWIDERLNETYEIFA
jgi:5-methylcytosine-specific restriction endonuclease McrA